MSLNDHVDRVRRLCPELSDEQLLLFRQDLRGRALAPRQALHCVGDVPQAVAFVERGLLKAVYTDPDGNRVNVNFFREGNGTGNYQAFRERSSSRYDFITIEASELILLPFDHFEQCCRRIPQLERYYRIVVERTLFTYIRRAGALPRLRPPEPGLFKRLSVSDLCSYLGIQRQALTRIRKQLLER